MIRPAAPADAEGIDSVHVRAWEQAYADFIPPDRMKGAAPVDERVPLWRERLEHEEIRTWVWDQDGFIAGFAAAGQGALWALYVDPTAQGAGVGTALLARVEEALRGWGCEQAELWVFTANEHGRRFYEAHGWELVPDSESEVDFAAPGVCYRKAL